MSRRKNKRRTAKIDITKYKTKLCKKYSIHGVCPYYEKCQFAHGTDELRNHIPATPKIGPKKGPPPGFLAPITLPKNLIQFRKDSLSPDAPVFSPKTEYDVYWKLIEKTVGLGLDDI